MKKIIDGVTCDTEKAKLLAEKFFPDKNDKKKEYTEALYITKSGKYFIYGKGGQNSAYGNGFGTTEVSEKINLISEELADEWKEENLLEEEIENIKKNLTSSKTKRKITTRVSIKCSDLLDELKDKPRKNYNDIIEESVEYYYDLITKNLTEYQMKEPEKLEKNLTSSKTKRKITTRVSIKCSDLLDELKDKSGKNYNDIIEESVEYYYDLIKENK